MPRFGWKQLAGVGDRPNRNPDSPSAIPVGKCQYAPVPRTPAPTTPIIAKDILKEIKARIGFLLYVGLDYLNLNRSNSRFVAGVSSVVDDAFFNGQEFKFTLNRALGANEEFDETTGLWKLGDTVAVKWCLIDQNQYDFWNTLEVSKQRQGPFSSYIRIKGNVDGALGVWAGSSCEIYKVIVKK